MEFIRPASPFVHLLFDITITINVVIVIFFLKMYYLRTDSGFVKYVGYTGKLQTPQYRYGINLTPNHHYADNV